MEIRFILAFILFAPLLKSQELELNAGFNSTYFYKGISLRDDDQYAYGTYSSKGGYAFGLDFTHPYNSKYSFGLGLRLLNYSADLSYSSSALSGSSHTVASVNKTVLGLDCYPFNVYCFEKKMKFSFGFEVNFLCDENTTGYTNWTNISMGSGTENVTGRINLSRFGGVMARCSYSLKIKDKWAIVPQYSMYKSVDGEFRLPFSYVKSFRMVFLVGISRKLWGDK